MIAFLFLTLYGLRAEAGFACPSSTSISTWGNRRMEVTRQSATECARDFCFRTTKIRFPFSSSASAELDSQNCRPNIHQLSNVNCDTQVYASGYQCIMCVCTPAQNETIVWQEYTTSGRTCQAYRCRDLGTTSNCSVTNRMVFAPSTNWGMYMPSGNLGPASVVRNYDEYNTQNYSCPPAAGQFCVNNPKQTAHITLTNAVNYGIGSFYYGQSNATLGCIINQCVNTGGTATSWTTTTFAPGVEVSADTTLMSFAQKWCRNDRDLQPCLATGSNLKLFYEWNSNNCLSGSICSSFYCACPTTAPNNGDMFYRPLQTPLTRGSGFPFSALTPKWKGTYYKCVAYQCFTYSSSKNYTRYSSQQTSTYGGVYPCDPVSGYSNNVAKYWNGGSMVAVPPHRRTPIIAQWSSSSLNPYGGPSSPNSPSYATIENSTCAALGYGTCWEVKRYDLTTYSYRIDSQGLSMCPGGLIPQVVKNDGCNIIAKDCKTTTNRRTPKDVLATSGTGVGNFINTRIQCFGSEQNLVMQKYCMKNTKLQTAYENFDKCLYGNRNYALNVEPKATGTCRGYYRDVYLGRGQCDHPLFRNYIQTRANCYCGMVRDMNSGAPNTAYMRQSMMYQFDRLVGTDSGLTSMFTLLDNYGCTYAPITCDVFGGGASFTVERPVMTGQMKVRLQCSEINVYAVQRELTNYLSSAGVANGNNPTNRVTRNLRILSMTDETNPAACLVKYKAYVVNSVWANYINGNLTAKAGGNANAVYESISSTSLSFETTAAASSLMNAIALAVALVGVMFV